MYSEVFKILKKLTFTIYIYKISYINKKNSSIIDIIFLLVFKGFFWNKYLLVFGKGVKATSINICQKKGLTKNLLGLNREKRFFKL